MSHSSHHAGSKPTDSQRHQNRLRPKLEIHLPGLAADSASRRPSAPVTLQEVSAPSCNEGLDFSRRHSAQADGSHGQSQRDLTGSTIVPEMRRLSTARMTGDISLTSAGSQTSIHAIAERLSQPLPDRRCSLLDDRSRRLSRFVEPPASLTATAGIGCGQRSCRNGRKPPWRYCTCVIVVLLGVLVSAMAGTALYLSHRHESDASPTVSGTSTTDASLLSQLSPLNS